MDPIADMLNTIKTTKRVNKTATIPVSKLKLKILEILKSEGFVSSFEIDDQKPHYVEIKPGKKMFESIKRISKPGRRLYTKMKDIKTRPGRLAILSTPLGILTAQQARKQHTGGEILFEVLE